MSNIETAKGEIVMYQPDETIRLEVRMGEETVWLTQQQMAELFLTTRNNITLHIRNIFNEGELNESSVRKESLLTAADGKKVNGEARLNPSMVRWPLIKPQDGAAGCFLTSSSSRSGATMNSRLLFPKLVKNDFIQVYHCHRSNSKF